MRYAAVLDGTRPDAALQARALAGFLGAGLRADDGTAPAPSTGAEGARPSDHAGLEGETIVFYHESGDREGLVDLAPTTPVRVVRAPPHRTDRLAEVLAAGVGGPTPPLFVFAGGPAGDEAAARLARRAGGSALTAALDVSIGPHRLVGRRHVYSGHMTGRFALAAPPWCVTVDPTWSEAPAASCGDHVVLSDDDATAGAGTPPFEDVDLGEAPSAGDLERARVLVVAGGGAGGGGVARVAAAAQRMGAAFGCTRPVAMNAWAPVDRLIGVSGTRVAPALALVVAASGAPAFLWGIERAGVIVAVNTDEQAPIVAESDLAVIGDGVAVTEALAALLAAGPDGD